MKDLAEGEYRVLARLHYVLRRLVGPSEQEARHLGLTPAQHQLLLAIRGLGRNAAPSISELAERLQQRHHSVVELVDRAEAAGLVVREPDPSDRRRGEVGNRREFLMALLVVLIILALIFGVGAVVKGILWVLAIAAALVILAVYVGWRTLKGSGS